MKAMKKVLALALALAMTVTAVPVTDAQAAAAKLKAGKTVSKSYYAGTKHALKLNGVKAANVTKTSWSSSDASIVKCIAGTKTKTSASIRCVKAGKATITAKVTLKTNKTKTYKAKVKVKAISVDATAVKNTLSVGETTTITATKVGPKNAALTYKSENDAIVTVSGGKVTATGAGTANVIVELTSGNKVKRALIPFTVTAAEEGLKILGLTNPISADYPNTVWVNQPASVNVQYVRDGKPVAGETLIMTEKRTTSYGDQRPTSRNGYVATTNANGIATFVIGYNDENIKATDGDYAAAYNFTVSTSNGSAKDENGHVAFAAIDLGTIKLQNLLSPWVDPKRPADLGDIKVSTNDRKDQWTAGNGYTTTTTPATQKVKDGAVVIGRNVDYVDSQQVSTANTTDRQVAFYNYMPQIKLPNDAQDLSRATRYQQDVNISSGSYGVYTNKAEYVELGVKPSELTYATLNFSKIQLSEHTKMVIATYKNKSDAEGQNNAIRPAEVIRGATNMLTNGYQIPLDTDYDGLVIRIDLVSEGQVNTSMNAGYEAKDITGVYKTVADGKYTYAPLNGAKVEWKKETIPMSNVMTLSNDENTAIKIYSGVDLLATYKGGVTYQVPVYPYTGNAVLTCRNENGEVKAYYVCPTINGSEYMRNGISVGVLDDYGVGIGTTDSGYRDLKLGQNIAINKNVLDIYWSVKVTGGVLDKDSKGFVKATREPANFCYEVSYEEAFTQEVGTITEEASRVVVNSEKVGVTGLVGTLTLDGEEIAALDATNDRLYTSVQWSPRALDTVESGFEYALVGQSVTVTAQLVDVNNNPVTVANETIEFRSASGIIEKAVPTGESCVRTVPGKWWENAKDAVVPLNVEGKTNSLGQASMVLQSSESSMLTGVYATDKNGRYKVILNFKNGDKPEKVDIHWFDVDLKFTKTAIDNEDGDGVANESAQTSATEPFVKTDDKLGYNNTTDDATKTLVTPKTGSSWEFGFQLVPDVAKHGLPPVIGISGVGIKMSKDVTTVGATPTFPSEKNGVAVATSNKAGQMDIIGKLDSTSSVTDVVFSYLKGYWQYTEVKCVGEGAPSLNKKLTLNVHWEADGIKIEPVSPNGMVKSTLVTTGSAIKTVYVKVTDKNGSPITDKQVRFVINGTDATLQRSAVVDANDPAYNPLTAATPVTNTDGDIIAWNVMPDKYGIARIDVKHSGTITVSTVTAYVNYNDPANQMEVAQVIHWNTSAAPTLFVMDDNKDTTDGTYVTSIKNGKIILTFKDNIIPGSVIKDMFTVTDGTSRYEVMTSAVYGNYIVLTVKNLPTNLAANEPIRVQMNAPVVEGVKYILTSDEGCEIPALDIDVFDGTIVGPGTHPVAIP